MKIPSGATGYCPPLVTLTPGHYRGRTIRHTFRIQGTRDWLLIYTQAGSGLYRSAAGVEHRSQPGDVTLYGPGAFQDYQFAPGNSGWDLVWAHFLAKPEWLTWLKWPEIVPGLMGLKLHEPPLRRRVLQRMKDMVRLISGSEPRGQALALNALEEVLLWCDSVNPERPAKQRDPRISRAMDFLTVRLAEPFSEAKLAGSVGLSPSRFRHLFREQVGDSARNFQEQERLRQARDRLALSRQTIGEIALELGFANPFYFTLRFKKHMGESPRAFRTRMTRS